MASGSEQEESEQQKRKKTLKMAILVWLFQDMVPTIRETTV